MPSISWPRPRCRRARSQSSTEGIIRATRARSNGRNQPSKRAAPSRRVADLLAKPGAGMLEAASDIRRARAPQKQRDHRPHQFWISPSDFRQHAASHLQGLQWGVVQRGETRWFRFCSLRHAPRPLSSRSASGARRRPPRRRASRPLFRRCVSSLPNVTTCADSPSRHRALAEKPADSAPGSIEPRLSKRCAQVVCFQHVLVNKFKGMRGSFGSKKCVT